MGVPGPRAIFRMLPIDLRKKKWLKYLYFRTLATIRVPAYPALNELDRKMRRYLPERGGIFVEVGANDGLSQSNTWFLEYYQGWTGLLIEPVPSLANMAQRFRRSPVAAVALGGWDSDGQVLRLAENDLITSAVRWSGTDREIEVPVRSLSSLLDEYGLGQVDFFSLDVEGFEKQVLDGIDFQRHRPDYILVETESIDDVRARLDTDYRFIDALSVHDYLFRVRSPIGGPTVARMAPHNAEGVN